MKKLLLCLLLSACASEENVANFYTSTPSHVGSPSHVQRFLYGYPAAQTYEPNVKIQYIFDESSSPIVDEVAGLSLPFQGNSTPTYLVTTGGPYGDISPAITFPGSGDAFSGIYGNFRTGSASIAVGSSDHYVVEWWMTLHSAPTASIPTSLWSINATTGFGGTDIISPYWQSGSFFGDELAVEVGGFGDVHTFDLPYTELLDGRPHYFKFVLDYNADNMFLEVDGAPIPDGSFTSLPSDVALDLRNTTITDIGIPGRPFAWLSAPTNIANVNATFYEWRASVGPDVLNNSSYPSFHCGTPGHIAP